jgi:hypothetical protein
VIKRITLSALCLLFLTGCSTPTQPALLEPPQAVITQIDNPDSGVELPVTSKLILQSGDLVLTVLSPTEGEIVAYSPVEVVIVSNVETVFTINGDLFLLAAGNESTFLVSLVEGFNSIELVASDYQGNQVETVLSVIYEP